MNLAKFLRKPFFMEYLQWLLLVNHLRIGHKLNVDETYGRHLESLMNVLCKFNLHSASRRNSCFIFFNLTSLYEENKKIPKKTPQSFRLKGSYFFLEYFVFRTPQGTASVLIQKQSFSKIL